MGWYLHGVTIERLETAPFMPFLKTVKVKTMGNIVQIQALENRNHMSVIQRLDNDTYLNKRTGEVGEICHMTSREQDKKSLARSMRELREVINTNVTDTNRVRWVTLTYAENMTDTSRLYDDFRKFNQRFQYYLDKKGYAKAEYISCVEPQARGAWHCHVLYIWQTKAPFIPNEVLAEIWGHGYTNTKALKNIDNVGAYLTAYLTDISLDDAQKNGINFDNISKGKETNDKYYVKGGRLALYPANARLYRYSCGIKKPTIEYMSPERAFEFVKDAVKTYEKHVKIHDTDTDFSSRISTYEYNMVRNHSENY